MDAFEQIIGQLLEEENYWIRRCVRIELNKDEKRQINKPSIPRPEIDIVAYDILKNTVYLLEVKSFIDSNGVVFEHATANHAIQEGRYKLLTSETYQNVIEKRLKEDWLKCGLITSETTFKYGLIAGKVYKNREVDLRQYYEQKGYFFWGPTKIKEKINKLATKGYENNSVTIVTKLLTR